jgi:hypothetical protein
MRHLPALACAALLVGTGPVPAADTLPNAITFDGHCDGLTHIKFAPGHGTVGGSVITGTWDRSACGLPSAPSSTVTGTYFGHEHTSGTYDTASLGIAPFVVRFEYGFYGWTYVGMDGEIIDRGTWTAGYPGADAALRPPTRTRAAAGDRPASLPVRIEPDSFLPPEVHLDGHCDGFTGVDGRQEPGIQVVTATWNTDACGLPSAAFSGLHSHNRGRPSTVIGTVDTLGQGLGYPSLTMKFGGEGTWIYYDSDGLVVNSGTWHAGPPGPDGPLSILP